MIPLSPAALLWKVPPQCSYKRACFLSQPREYLGVKKQANHLHTALAEVRKKVRKMGPSPKQVLKAHYFFPAAHHFFPSTSDMSIMVPATPSVLFEMGQPSPQPLLSVFFAEKQLLTGLGVDI